VAQFFGAIETGARGATSQIQAGTGALQSMVQTAESISFDSLEEKFGIDPRAFDVDVLNEMRSALGDAGVETDVASEAMKRYELQIGAATASSEIFNDQMDALAQQLADGSISADEYVDSVTRLSQADYSWVDRLTQPLIDAGDIDMAQRYIDIVGQMSSMSWTAAGVQTAELGIGAEMGIGEGGGGVPGEPSAVPAGPFAPLIDGSVEATKALGDLETEGGAHVANMLNLATGQFESFRADAIGDIRAVRTAWDEIGNLSTNISVTTSGAPASTAGRNIPEFQHGGAVRTRGRVDPGEYVVPQGGALVLKDPAGGWAKSGGGERKETIVTKVIVNDREIAKAVADVDRRRNKE
jgi:hypothetical protein